MEWIEVAGHRPLHGRISVQGSKNAALPVLAGTVLHQGTTVLHHCPQIQDVEVMLQILNELGCRTKWENDTVVVDATSLSKYSVGTGIGGKMRSSIMLLGSLLGRFHRACVPYPGGCIIGARPVDLHLQAFRMLGASVEETEEMICVTCQGLKGAVIELGFPSVGATENSILGAVLAEGTTTIRNCAMEPEIIELCRFLNEKGADIQGAGTCQITIKGVRQLHDSEYHLMADRIVAGTYLCAAAATRGNVEMPDAPVWAMQTVIQTLRRLGAFIYTDAGCLILEGAYADRALDSLVTAPYPGFPTDLQSPMMAVLTGAKGRSSITEQMFEARFGAASQLQRMGAQIVRDGQTVHITGVERLHEATVEAAELRGGAALVIAGLMAEGITRIDGYSHIRRGYEQIDRDLQQMGAEISICGTKQDEE